ncbi:DUF4300 family protein [Mobiluncus mulieris]|uniref:DUF4300 family protein n=1 Tax=Mobiluncus mulieris TaxID=2052 RepID=UPI000E023705|nr:DUF4300 family protein [Mobiluncus mulieris]STY83618.1 Uncharacterised protein [Mobiluncus mulieris]
MKNAGTRRWQSGFAPGFAPALGMPVAGTPGRVRLVGVRLVVLALIGVLGLSGVGLSGCTSSVPAGSAARIHEAPSGKNGVNPGLAPHEKGDPTNRKPDQNRKPESNQASENETDMSASHADKAREPGSKGAPVKYQVSNLADAASRAETAAALKAALPAPDVDAFLAAVKDYNDTIQNTSLTSGFAPIAPQYDLDKIDKLWQGTKGKFIGVDCRISTFGLVKSQLKTPPAGSADAALLFQDLEAIQTGKLFNAADTQHFKQLFSRVKTTKTTDVKAHAAKMASHFKAFTFPARARVVTVVINDNLDGNYLFVGHTGVLVSTRGKWLFVEKVSFQEPYQVLKFDSPQDCYRYLADKYRDYADDGAAKPFVMENGRLVYPQ